MITARTSLAYFFVALLAWTSIAAGVFASNGTPAAAASNAWTASIAQAGLVQEAYSPRVESHQHGHIHHVFGDQSGVDQSSVQTVSTTGTAPESACVSSCLDTIAAKLAPLPQKTIEPNDSQGTSIVWPQLAAMITALPFIDHTQRATGPPEPPQLERSGAARLVLTNGRLRI